MKPLLSFSEWVRTQYQVIIISAVVLGLSLGIWTTKPGIFLAAGSYLLTFLMIIFISLTITPQQFKQVRYQPTAVAAGLLLNFVFMPLLCWGMARLFVSDSHLATGVILVGVVPCAGMAAVWTAFQKGDVPNYYENETGHERRSTLLITNQPCVKRHNNLPCQ